MVLLAINKASKSLVLASFDHQNRKVNSGVFRLDVGEILTVVRNLERYQNVDLNRADLRIVVSHLELSTYKIGELLRRFKSKLGTMQIVRVEAQDLEEGNRIFFHKQEVIHVLTSTKDSDEIEGFVELSFGGMKIDAEPDEEFEVLL